MKKAFLMCVTNLTNWEESLEDIKTIFRPEGVVFILQSKLVSEEMFITFNCDMNHNFRMPGIIKVNRRESTLFTVNFINALSKRELGYEDKKYPVKWEEYTNCFCTTRDGDINVIPTKLYGKVEC